MLVRNNCLVIQSAITALVQSDPDDQHLRTGPSLIGEGAIYSNVKEISAYLEEPRNEGREEFHHKSVCITLFVTIAPNITIHAAMRYHFFLW